MANEHPFSRIEDFERAAYGRAPTIVIDAAKWCTPYTNNPLAGGRNISFASEAVRVTRRYEDVGFRHFEGLGGYAFATCPTRLPYARYELREGRRWREWMVDQPLHWLGTGIYARAIRGGRVLVAGLGMGLVLWWLCENPDIESIVVVEQSAEAIKEMQPYLPRDKRIQYVHGDYYDFIAGQANSVIGGFVARMQKVRSAKAAQKLREDILTALYERAQSPAFDFVYFDLAVGDPEDTSEEFKRGELLTAVYLGGVELIQFGRINNNLWSAAEHAQVLAARAAARGAQRRLFFE